MTNILEIKNLTTHYGENKILDKLSLSVKEGEIVMLVGSNGAGKSTLLKSIFGITKTTSGTISIDRETIIPEPHRLVELGVSFVPQGFRIFQEMSVQENLKIGGYILDDKELIEQRIKEIYKIFPVLKRKRKLISSSLSGGERQILALGRSLMLKPKLLLLDEPSVGLAPKIVKEVFDKIQEINKEFGTSIIIVEHNLKSLLKIADKALILYQGKIAKQGTPKELLKSKILKEVFFGKLA